MELWRCKGRVFCPLCCCKRLFNSFLVNIKETYGFLDKWQVIPLEIQLCETFFSTSFCTKGSLVSIAFVRVKWNFPVQVNILRFWKKDFWCWVFMYGKKEMREISWISSPRHSLTFSRWRLMKQYWIVSHDYYAKHSEVHCYDEENYEVLSKNCSLSDFFLSRFENKPK